MKKLLLSMLLTTILPVATKAQDQNIIEESNFEQEDKPAAYVFNFIIKGEKKSQAWKKILDAARFQLQNIQKRQAKNSLEKKQNPIDEIMGLMSKIQRFVNSDTRLSATFSHEKLLDPVVNPEELEPNTLIVRFAVIPTETQKDNSAIQMAETVLDDFINILETAENITFETIKNYFQKLDTIAQLSEQEDEQAVKTTLCLWVKKG